MTISYNKMWKLLIDKKLSKVILRKNADIAVQDLHHLPVSVAKENRLDCYNALEQYAVSKLQGGIIYEKENC